MARIYLTGALSECKNPFEWQDSLQESDKWDGHDFLNPYNLNEFSLGSEEVYKNPEGIVEPALEEVADCDGLLVKWNDDAFLVGTVMELMEAYRHDVPAVIWYDGYKDNLSPWLSYHTRGSFEEKEKALQVLLGFAERSFTFSK